MITDKQKRRIQMLIDQISMREKQGQANTHEYTTAVGLRDLLLENYGLTLSDFAESKQENAIQKLEFVPSVKGKKNPTWLKSLFQVFACFHETRAVVFTDKIGCAVFGATESLKECVATFKFVLERSNHTFQVISNFQKRIVFEDYMIGFIFGYLAQLQKKEDEAKNRDTAEREATMLAVISRAIAILQSADDKAKQDGVVKGEDADIRITDDASYMHGYRDGYHAKDKLFRK